MVDENQEKKQLLPHHEAQSLCTTRLPYRQGRKLTAVKVYSINSESNHLLIFGVPSLNLRHETKALLSKFGKLLTFSLSTEYSAEPFTENFHAVFDQIQSARIAKKMLDTKNFYGGSLHICYVPELETIDETRSKLFKRHRDVLNRIRNLNKDDVKNVTKDATSLPTTSSVEDKKYAPQSKINMGEYNVIAYETKSLTMNKNKRKVPPTNKVLEKRFKPNFVQNTTGDGSIELQENNELEKDKIVGQNSNHDIVKINNSSNIEIVDFVSTEKEVITNIDESLNYNKFGNEIIRKVLQKPVNRIKFNVGNKL